MYLKSLQLKNYRCFKDLTIEFDPGFNAVVGVNGSGKTSLLHGLADAYALVVQGFGGSRTEVLAPANTRIESVRSKDAVLFEPRFPVQLCARGVRNRRDFEWQLERMSQKFSLGSSELGPGLKREHLLDDESKYPIFAYLRAARGWLAPVASANPIAVTRESRLDAFLGCFDAAANAGALIAWVTAKSLERLQSAVAAGVKFDEVQNDELYFVNAALCRAINGFRSIRFDFHQKAVLISWEDQAKDETFFEQLSDGQRGFISIVADIARRACLLNPMLGPHRALDETPGLVLIDELDLHLHPRWQREIPIQLKRTFPCIQFICTTHAPQILGELQPEEIILLRPENATHPSVSYGLDASQVLEEIMGAPARSVGVKASLDSLFLALEQNALDVAREQLSALRKEAPGIPELVGASALLKRKELLGR